MTEKGLKLSGYLFFGVGVLVFVIGIIILPETLLMQISTSTSTPTMLSKWIVLPVLLVGHLVLGFYLQKEKEKLNMGRLFIYSIVIIVVDCFVFFMNL